ncbi:CAP domain-containing protein [Heyndrickxia shackletonii]|uniref:CAP domain-containing protein n=1 Tax=Heyndrickxia TaxID=2837504 RepID=UPI003F5AB35C
MRTFIKVLIVLAIIFIISLYFHLRPDNDSTILNGDNSSHQPKKDPDNLITKQETGKSYKRPVKGISTFIGKKTNILIKTYGRPSRIDSSAYDYDWWIYNHNDKKYFQAGVENGKVVTIFAIGNDLGIQPFRIGEKVEDIYKSILLNTEILVNYNKGYYRFELSEEDLNIRPLIKLGDIFAQLSLDKFTGTLSSIRFMNKETLIKQRPYEMVYRGELIKPKEPDDAQWNVIEKGSEQQIFDLTNIIRERFKLNKLEWDSNVAQVAYQHSEDMFKEQYFSHESPKYGDLAKRLETAHVFYQLAGENIAAQYLDGPAAVEGWLNSEGHRKSLLEKGFTHLGVGVYQKYYTQNFIEKSWK